MKALVVSEFRKLITTRTAYLLAAGALVISVVTVLDPNHTAASFEKPFHEQTYVFFASLLTRILVVVLGIRAMTDEYRHGTIVSTLLETPRRSRVLIAKSLVIGATGAVIAVLAWGAMFGAASVVASSEGASLAFDDGAMRSLIGTTIAGAAWAILGVAVGAVIRSQVVATVGAVIWLMALEQAFVGLLGDLDRFLPGNAGLGLALAPSMKALAAGAGVMAVYIVVSGIAGAAVMRRDVT